MQCLKAVGSKGCTEKKSAIWCQDPAARTHRETSEQSNPKDTKDNGDSFFFFLSSQNLTTGNGIAGPHINANHTEISL